MKTLVLLSLNTIDWINQGYCKCQNDYLYNFNLLWYNYQDLKKKKTCKNRI